MFSLLVWGCVHDLCFVICMCSMTWVFSMIFVGVFMIRGYDVSMVYVYVCVHDVVLGARPTSTWTTRTSGKVGVLFLGG